MLEEWDKYMKDKYKKVCITINLLNLLKVLIVIEALKGERQGQERSPKFSTTEGVAVPLRR